jgi:hypothetical protein
MGVWVGKCVDVAVGVWVEVTVGVLVGVLLGVQVGHRVSVGIIGVLLGIRVGHRVSVGTIVWVGKRVDVGVRVRVGDRVDVVVSIMVCVEVSVGSGVVDFSCVGSGVIISTFVAVIVAGKGVGVASKARNPLDIGDQKKTAKKSTARIASRENALRPALRLLPWLGLPGGGAGGR